MSSFFIEIGEDSSPSNCKCCNNKSNTGHGFIYKNEDAYGVYYAGWSNSHKERTVTFALALGEWGDDSTTSDRTCIGFESYESGSEILFSLINPEESPWPNSTLLGKMLKREEALNSPLLKEFFLIAEEILRNHPAIKKYLRIS